VIRWARGGGKAAVAQPRKFVELAPRERVEGRDFTDPAHSRADVEVLARRLPAWLAPLGGGGAGRVRFDGELPDGRAMRHVVNRRARLGEPRDLVVVGFCGQRRPDVDREPLEAADEELILEFPTQPHLISYSTIRRPDDQASVNLVLFEASQGITDWQENATHEKVVADHAEKAYHSIRLHRGLMPGGLGPEAQVELWDSKYFHYAADGLWFARRDLGRGELP